MTVFKWKQRTTFEERPHTAHRLQTTLSPAQEALVVELRKTLLQSLQRKRNIAHLYSQTNEPIQAALEIESISTMETVRIGT